MSPIQQMLLGAGAKKSSVYIDDCFYTHVYEGDGNSSGQNITGSDFEPDLVWIKGRNHTANHILVDSARGNNKVLYSNTNDDQDTNEDYVNSRFVGGFKVGNSGITNGSNETNVGWTWKKTPGFLDIVKFTTTNTTNQRVAHQLGCIPGLILLKNIDSAQDWLVYHRSLGEDKYLQLSKTDAVGTFAGTWGPDGPTSTDIGFKSNGFAPTIGDEYIAYIFAGGESNASEARSVEFDGSSDFLSVGSTSDFQFGTGDYTVEAWLKPEDLNTRVWLSFGMNNPSFKIISGKWEVYNPAVGSSIYSGVPAVGQWTHYAIARSSGTTKIFINGIETNSFSDTLNVPTQEATIGAYSNDTFEWKGGISNVRVVKGTAVYTSSFKPPTEPLTNITNTKLLCCNNSSTTGSTVAPGTITAVGNPTASSDSPFDDPAGYVFGENEDQNVISTGSYVGNGSSGLGPVINLGWEPSFLMVKASSFANEHWHMFDSMRGIVSDGDDKWLYPNLSNAEPSAAERIDLTSTGFKIKTNRDELNKDGETFIWMAIRRPDGYCGKPRTATELFAMDTGASSSTIPAFDSNFIVDMAFARHKTVSNNWSLGTRSIQGKYLDTNLSNGEAAWSAMQFDSNLGWGEISAWDASYQAWMWKRHAGFDVVCYKSDGVAGRQVPHSLSKTPEMIWLKQRSTSGNSWVVGHKGLNGGTDPWDYALKLNGTDAEANAINKFNDTAPTSTHFTVGDSSWVNGTNNYDQIAMLFASVDGISKVGEFDGSSSDVTLTTGFTPRFIIIKSTTHAQNWCVFDTLRSLGSSGNDKLLKLNSSAAESAANTDYVNTTATGFVVKSGQSAETNGGSTYKYIYYAHS